MLLCGRQVADPKAGLIRHEWKLKKAALMLKPKK